MHRDKEHKIDLWILLFKIIHAFKGTVCNFYCQGPYVKTIQTEDTGFVLFNKTTNISNENHSDVTQAEMFTDEVIL